jgi:tRNA(Ile2) C34 agmatinyltransferase TiaS
MTEFYTNAVKELKNIYDNLNRDYYNNELPEVVITIQSSPKGKAYGWYAKDRWGVETDKEKVFDEINISAEYLSRPLENICGTLQHEMVHLYCAINEIKDTSNNNVYHNKKFKEEAEKRGLSIEKAQTIGWSVTTPTEEFIEYIRKLNINEDSFKFFRKMPLVKEKVKKATKKTTKYTCPVCEVSVRGEHNLEIECKKCGVLMESKH